MAEEQKTASAANTNTEAEKDVQNILAELKGDRDQAAPEKKEGAATEDAEEARIIAEANKLGEKSEKAEEKAYSKSDTRARGGRANRRGNVKFDPTTQKETDDPVEIRKQVSHFKMRHVAIRPCRIDGNSAQGRILLLRLQPPNGQIPSLQSWRQRQPSGPSEPPAVLQTHGTFQAV